MTDVNELKKHDVREMNRDPITGEPGAHPLGTGVGAASGAIVGGVVGAIAGPIGSAIGVAVGAVAGGLVGKDAGETVRPTNGEVNWTESHTEDDWTEFYRTQAYVNTHYTYEDYAPAYRAAHAMRLRNYDGSWEQAEPFLRANWERSSGGSRLSWDEARDASQAAWLQTQRPITLGAANG
jgi:hypothetical protein